MAQEWDATNKAQVIEFILDAMAAGQGLMATLRLPFMPSAATFARWRAESETLQSRYLRAREALADHWADEVVPIADTATNADTAAAARVRLDARRWAAGKYNSAYADVLHTPINAQGGLVIVLNRFEGTPQSPAPLVIVAPVAAPAKLIEG